VQQTNPSDPSSFWSKVRWTLLAIVGGLVVLAIALQGLHQKPVGDTSSPTAPQAGSVEPSTVPVPGAAPAPVAPAGDGGRSTNFNLN
jgi:small neutral amino acid transporter SnatA (MarC family)